MRKIGLLIALTWTAFNVMAQDPQDVLLTVGDKPVTVEEFKYIYEKNNGKKADYSRASLSEYLELYTKFKLKVQKAKELQMDTIKTLKEELDGYKRQLANSYLMEKEVLNHLQKELYNRMDTDVKISHIYTATSKTTTPNGRKRALRTIENAKKKLDAGLSFEQVAKEYSEDKNTKESGGQLGYFTAMMPNGYHELEDAMYNLQPGQTSDVIETSIGYHVIKVDDKRPARGKIQVAHIFIKKDTKDANNLANRIYNEIQGGMKFEDAAAKYSEDTKTKTKGGVLPEFGIGVYDQNFEDAAFALTEDGQVSTPFQSANGYHIIQRINKPSKPDFHIFKKIYESKIKKDGRYQAARKELVRDIKRTANFKVNQDLLNGFTKGLDESFLSYKWGGEMPIKSSDVLATFGGDTNYTLADFITFAKKNTRTRLKYDKTTTTPEEVANILFENFVDDKAIDYEQTNLGAKYADFRSLMREYEEGILLFEVTKDKVWDKANEDTTGLEAFYMDNKSNYMSEPQADLQMVFINTQDENLAKKIAKYLGKKSLKKTIKKFNKKSEVVATYSERLDQSNAQFAELDWKKGASSELLKDDDANRYYIKRITEVYAPAPKPLDKARGYVVADYQDYLEREWVKSLKAQYPVKVNQNVFEALVK